MDQAFHFLALAVFLAVLVYAAGRDLVTYRIPNLLPLALVAAFPAYVLGTGMGLEAALIHGLTGLAVLAAGFALFLARLWGGGDAKLAAAVALWAGSGGIAGFVLFTALAGGVLAAFVLIRGRVRNVPPCLLRVPYGVAIALAGIGTIMRPFVA